MRILLLVGLIILIIQDASAQSEYRVLKYLNDLGYTNTTPHYGTDYKYLQTTNGIIIDLWQIPGVPKPDYTNLPSEAVSLKWYQAKWQQDKPIASKVIENKYIHLCDRVIGSESPDHVKMGFSELEATFNLMTNKADAAYMRIQFSTISAEAEKLIGAAWLDTCIWHAEAIPNMSNICYVASGFGSTEFNTTYYWNGKYENNLKIYEDASNTVWFSNNGDNWLMRKMGGAGTPWYESAWSTNEPSTLTWHVSDFGDPPAGSMARQFYLDVR
jgi:hypothetical protein